MLVYLLNILSLIIYLYIYIHSKNKNKLKIILIFLIVMQFTLIQGLRSFEIGSDTSKYIQYYEYIKNGDFTFFELLLNPPLNFEFGYLAFMKICALFNLTSRFFLIVVSLVINALIGRYIYKESDDFILSFWIFIGIEFFTLSFTMIRQMIAIGIILNAYICLESKNYKMYFLLNILASLFHKTALIFIIIFFYQIIKDKIKKNYPKFEITVVNKIFIILVTMFIVAFCLGDIISFVAHIFYGYYHFSKSSIGFLWVVMMGILGLFLIIEKKSNKTDKLVNYEMFIFIAATFQLMTIHISQFSRATFYFYIFTITSLPYAITLIKNRNIRRFLKCSVYMLTFIQYIFFSMNIYNLVPYKIF